MPANISLYYIVVLLLVSACQEKPIDRNLYKEELENRKIVRANEGQILEIAQTKGARLLDTLWHAFENDAQTHGANRNGWICSIQQLPVSTTLRNEYGIHSFKKGSWNIDSISLKGQILAAYRYGYAQNQSFEDNLQKMGSDTLLLTRGYVVAKNTVCANCHAIGSVFMMGLAMPKKEIIKTISLKDLKALRENHD